MDNEIDDEMNVLSDDMMCTICYAEFLDVEDLQVHVKQVHLNDASKNRFCHICTQVFPDIEAYAIHLRNDHISKLESCKYCTSVFENTDELIKHEKKHNAAMFYPKISCSHCESLFYNRNELEKHEFFEHSDADGLALRGCLPILSSLLNMNIRQFLKASYSNIPYICAVCDTTTQDKNVYIQHLRDNNCRSMACNVCCNVFNKKSKLSGHIARHVYIESVNKNLNLHNKQCHKCKQFFKPGALSLHMKKCSSMNCVHCDITFHSVVEYASHVSHHTNKMLPLEVCMYCQRQMVGSEALEKHIDRIHKSQMHLYKYHCTCCNRLFKHPKFLFAHFYSQHKDLHPYTCTICNKKFRIRKNFTLHIKLDHKSIGFVEFDDNFHVSFTDKRSTKKSKCQDVLEATINKDNEKDNTNIQSKTSGDTTNCEDSDVLDEGECETKIKKLKGKPLKQPLDACENKKDHVSGASQKKIIQTQKERGSVIVNRVNNKRYCETIEKVAQKKRKYRTLPKRNWKNYNKLKIDIAVSSDDSDAPLQAICNKMKMRKNRKTHHTPWNKSFRYRKTDNKMFFCTICNQNCYTYQNYHHHRALHISNETKVCIKCHAKFNSVKDLDEHIKTEHSSSKLTETLKKLLDKRKKVEACQPKSVNDTKENDLSEEIGLSTSEKFRHTLKKVVFEKSNTKVTITPVAKNKISVKKYLENFTPENNEIKVTMLNHKLSLDTSGVKRRFPVIKLTKFTPEPLVTSSPVRLKMPVKFTDDTKDKCQVNIQIVQNILPTNINFGNIISDQQNYENSITIDDVYTECNIAIQNNTDNTPELAEEVLLLGGEVPNRVLHTLSLKNLIGREDVAIAHLLPQAPYYKISKLKNLLDKESQTLVFTEPQQEVKIPKDITLPNGKKLVNVNPLAHLLDRNAIDEVLKSRKLKSPYYKPKLKNISEAITKAIEKVETKYSVKRN